MENLWIGKKAKPNTKLCKGCKYYLKDFVACKYPTYKPSYMSIYAIEDCPLKRWR